jgi:threonyl-tRNA synthetase
MLTVGAKEIETKTFAVRTLDGKVLMGMERSLFLDTVKGHIRKRALSLEIFA